MVKLPLRVRYLCYYPRLRWSQGQGLNNKYILRVQVGFHPSMVLIALVYNSSNQNVLINDCYTCLQVLSKQLYVWNAYLSLLGYKT